MVRRLRKPVRRVGPGLALDLRRGPHRAEPGADGGGPWLPPGYQAARRSAGTLTRAAPLPACRRKVSRDMPNP
jgi:hypothetical protein